MTKDHSLAILLSVVRKWIQKEPYSNRKNQVSCNCELLNTGTLSENAPHQHDTNSLQKRNSDIDYSKIYLPGQYMPGQYNVQHLYKEKKRIK